MNVGLSLGAAAGWTALLIVVFRRRRGGLERYLVIILAMLVTMALARAIVFPPDLDAVRAIANLERFLLLIAPVAALLRMRAGS